MQTTGTTHTAPKLSPLLSELAREFSANPHVEAPTDRGLAFDVARTLRARLAEIAGDATYRIDALEQENARTTSFQVTGWSTHTHRPIVHERADGSINIIIWAMTTPAALERQIREELAEREWQSADAQIGNGRP